MRKKLLKLFPLVIAGLSLGFIGWVTISTNALGINYDPSIATPTDGYAIKYDATLRAYKAALSGGSPTDIPWGGTAASNSAGYQHLAIPLYIYPSTSWTTVGLTATKTSIIVADDTNGDPPVQDPNYVSAIAAAKTAGLTVLCYVPTNYAADSILTVEQKIDKAYTFYSPDGIFFDQAASAAASVPYYTTLYNYVRAKTGAALVALNPGTTCDEGYAAVSDIICTFEGTYASYVSYVPDTWTRKYNSTKFWHIVHDTTGAQLANAITLTKANGAGWVNVTDNASYGVLATYLAAEARQVGYAAGDDVRLPPPPLTAGRIPYDTTTGVTWTATGGTTTQVVHGGTTPSYGKVVVADIDSGAALNTYVATANGSGGVTWAAGGGAGAFGSPVSVNTANSDGVAATYARSDHVHTIAAGVITNAMVNASAAIVYSKLSLTASLVNADVAVGAAIAYSKLSLATSIVNGDISASAAIAYSKLALTGAIVNADVSASAAIAYSKLALTGSIVNADVSGSAAIAYSKLALTGTLLVADHAASALTGTGTKLMTDTGPTLADYFILTDTTAAAGAAGRFQRNGANLVFHDGTASRTIEKQSNKDAASGYAGLSASTKLALAEGQEVWGLVDLSDVAAKSGTGTTVAMTASPTFTGTVNTDNLTVAGASTLTATNVNFLVADRGSGFVCTGTAGSTIVCTLESVVVSDGTSGVRLTSVSGTVNSGTAGPNLNGRDQNAAFASGVWVYLYAVGGNGLTSGYVLSTSATAPTVTGALAGYKYSKPLTAYFSTTSGAVLNSFVHYGVWNYYASNVVSGGGATSFGAGTSVSSNVPPTGNQIRAVGVFTSATAGHTVSISYDGTLNSLVYLSTQVGSVVVRGGEFTVPIISQTVYYQVSNAGDTFNYTLLAWAFPTAN